MKKINIVVDDGIQIAIEYSKTAFTHKYIFPIRKDGKIYAVAVELTAIDLATICIVGEGSKEKANGAKVLRYVWNAERENYLKAKAIWTAEIGTLDEIERLYAEGGNGNRGEIFEYLVAVRLNGKQNAKKNLDYTKGGDVEINGIQYQVKYNKASLKPKK